MAASRPGTNNSTIFAEIVPEQLRSAVYAFDRSFEGAVGATAAPLVGTTILGSAQVPWYHLVYATCFVCASPPYLRCIPGNALFKDFICVTVRFDVHIYPCIW